MQRITKLYGQTYIEPTYYHEKMSIKKISEFEKAKD